MVQPKTKVLSHQEGPNSNKNRYQQINSELLQVFELELSWKMFKSFNRPTNRHIGLIGS